MSAQGLPDCHTIRDLVRTSAPARRVRTGGAGVIGLFPSSKMQRTVQYESLLEFHYIVWREWQPDVLEYYDQPLTIPLIAAGPSRSRRSTHTPDFLVVRHDEMTLEEVKPKAKVAADPRVQARSEQARAWAEARGIGYAVITEDDFPPRPILGNLVFLVTFQTPPAELKQFEGQVLQAVREQPGVTMTALIEEVADKDARRVVPCVWHLICRHRLIIDLAREPLRPGAEARTPIYPAEPRA